MVSFEESAGDVRCVFKGRLDAPACQELEARVMERVDQATGMVTFDLEEVDYISSMFFRLCIQASKSLDTGLFAVTGAQPEVRNMFRIAGLSQMLNVR